MLISWPLSVSPVVRFRATLSHIPSAIHKRLRRSSSFQMSGIQFTQHVNTVSGKMEWKVQNREEYDYFRDVARSSYADMLHDTERNQLYHKAIRLAVKQMHSLGKKAKVLDIGTGTGLLSMMAAKAGADTITAIEVFEPMAEVAKLITKSNGFGNINVINKHSTEVEVGEDKDMAEKANILITELFDTELIGEGALEAYQHAHQHLMEKECIAVPHSATTYAQLVESDIMHSWHSLSPIKIACKDGSEAVIKPDPRMKECPGVPAVHDIQLSQIQRSQFKEITKAVEVFKFEWGSRNLSSAPRNCTVETKACSTGTAQVILSWWTLDMDQKGDIVLSTAPYWYHPTPNNMQWRDHWIQSVYFLPKTFETEAGESIHISAFHDAFSLWFDARIVESDHTRTLETSRPVCDYLPRMLWSRPRLGMLNDSSRNEAFVKALKKVKFGSSSNHVAVCVSDVTLLPLLVAKTCVGHWEIFSLESDPIAQRGIRDLIEHNEVSGSINVVASFSNDGINDKSPLLESSINLLIGEPFFNASLLPWHDLRFWYARSELNKYLCKSACIMPKRARLCLAAVHFQDLWKIRAPVNSVEGFNVSIMDEMITRAMEAEDFHEPEPHYLWEYPCFLLSSVTDALTFDFTNPVPDEEIHAGGQVKLHRVDKTAKNISCHGVALWLVYDLDEEITVSTGLLEGSCAQQKNAKWDMHHKQGVFFLRQPVMVRENESCKISYEVTFIPGTGDVRMRFEAVDESS